MGDAVNEKTIAEVVKLARQSGEVRTVEGGNTPFIVIPNDCKIEPLAKLIDNDMALRPIRKKAAVQVLDPPSFCEYYALFSDPNSRVFADEQKREVLAILDYHATGENAPRWCQHRVTLKLRSSEEWGIWKGKDGNKFNQMEFAEFLEDNTPDIVSPNAATMLEVAKHLNAKTEVDFSSAVRTNNGQVQFKYTENIKATVGAGNIDVPEQFTVMIPVYTESNRISVTSRLRYRINSGKLTFWYNLLRSDEVERNAFKEVLAYISEKLAVTVINGTPV